MHRFFQSISLAALLVFAASAVSSSHAQYQNQAPPAAAPRHHTHRPGQRAAAPGTAAATNAPANFPGAVSQMAAPAGAPQRDHLPLRRTAPVASPSRSPKNAVGEEFFIIASIDQSRSQVLLKHPSEVTELMQLTPNTKYLDENGKPIRMQNFRAGDTVWVVSSGSGPEPNAAHIRKGQMTVADLHRYYLDYPVIN
jgi:hypothetical protein